MKWASVSPTEPAPTGTSETIALSISVSGDYYQVLDYINQLENMPRLVVVDQISLTSATDVNGAATRHGVADRTDVHTGRCCSPDP